MLSARQSWKGFHEQQCSPPPLQITRFPGLVHGPEKFICWLEWSMNRVCCLISLFVRADKSNTTKPTVLRFRRGFFKICSFHGVPWLMEVMGVTLESRKPTNILYSSHWWKEMQMFTSSRQLAYLIHYLSQRILMCTGTFLGRSKMRQWLIMEGTVM